MSYGCPNTRFCSSCAEVPAVEGGQLLPGDIWQLGGGGGAVPEAVVLPDDTTLPDGIGMVEDPLMGDADLPMTTGDEPEEADEEEEVEDLLEVPVPSLPVLLECALPGDNSTTLGQMEDGDGAKVLAGSELKEAMESLKKRLQERQTERIDAILMGGAGEGDQGVRDNVRLHEEGWRDR